MNDEELTISVQPTVWRFVAVFGKGRLALPRNRVAKLAAAALEYLARYEPAALQTVVAPYAPKENC